MIAIALICTALPANGLPVGQAVATSSTAPANLPEATAELFAPRELVLASATSNFEASFKAEVSKNGDMAKAEEEHPGLIDAVAASGRDVVLTQLQTSLPDLYASLADLIGTDFDFVEQRQLYDFMASPPGQRLVASGGRAYRKDKILTGLGPDKTRPSLTGDKLAGAFEPSFFDGLSDGDRQKIIDFSSSLGGQKLAAETPKMQQLMAEWLNKVVASQNEALEAAIVKRVAEFIANADGSGKKP